MRKFILPLLLCLSASMALGDDRNPYAAPALPTALGGNIAVDYKLLEDGSIWQHAYTIENYDPVSGTFAGTGHLIPDPSYTEIITGTLQGNLVRFHILYTGANANYTVDATGTMDDSGHFSGIAVSPGQGFTWTSTPSPR